MAKVYVRLCKGLSYSGIISATAKNPLVMVDETELDAVLATGYFQKDSTPVPSALDYSEQNQAKLLTGELNEKALLAMTVEKQLILAASLGIDGSIYKDKKERAVAIMEKLTAEVQPATEPKDGVLADGELFGGSETMINLQQ